MLLTNMLIFGVLMVEDILNSLQSQERDVNNMSVVLLMIHRILVVLFPYRFFISKVCDEHRIDSTYFSKNGVPRMLNFVFET